MLIIAGSGMSTGGRIVGHLKELLPVKETCVIFVGHQAAGTRGRLIQDSAGKGGLASVRIDGERVPMRAEITTLHGISAHADRGELVRWLRSIPNARRVALNHGDEKTQLDFAAYQG